jgi:hypothetical protein
LWKIWPENKVFIDARQFPYREWSEEYWKVFHSNTVYDHPEKIKAFIDRYPADLWLVGYDSSAVTQWLFHSQEWKLAFYGRSAAVFVRQAISIPGNNAIFSPDISTVKTMGNLQEVVYWTMVIKDWQAFDVLLARMEKYFIYPEQRREWEQWVKMARYLKREGKNLVLTAPIEK